MIYTRVMNINIVGLGASARVVCRSVTDPLGRGKGRGQTKGSAAVGLEGSVIWIDDIADIGSVYFGCRLLNSNPQSHQISPEVQNNTKLVLSTRPNHQRINAHTKLTQDQLWRPQISPTRPLRTLSGYFATCKCEFYGGKCQNES